MRDPIIKLTNLTKKYGDQEAVCNLNLNIYAGEIFGLLGPNGAGKSTTILMMLGLAEPSSGTALVCGMDATRYPMQVKRRVGYLPDDVGFYNHLSGMDNLIYTARLNRIPLSEARERAETLLKRVGLSEAVDKRVGQYSRGMRQRLGLADVLIKRPEVIILDEPTLGIDPEGVRELLELIHRLSREEGITVLISSHHLHQMQQICDRVGLFVGGKLLAEGDMATLAAALFPDEHVRIELRTASGASETGWINIVTALDDVVGVESNGSTFSIRCKSDISDKLAQAVIASGAGLTYLHKKEIGLDEIYHRYFES